MEFYILAFLQGTEAVLAACSSRHQQDLWVTCPVI